MIRHGGIVSRACVCLNDEAHALMHTSWKILTCYNYVRIFQFRRIIEVQWFSQLMYVLNSMVSICAFMQLPEC